MAVSTTRPCSLLARFVESYALRTASVGAAPVHLPLPARSDCFLEFHLDDPYHVLSATTGAMETSPRAVVVGPHLERRSDLLYRGRLLVFTVNFTPTGFHGLTGIPARHMLHYAEPASAIFGRSVDELAERLSACNGQLPAMAAATDSFLLRIVQQSRVGSLCGLGHAVRLIRSSHGACQIESVAAACQRSTRQVERDFAEQIGVSPKEYARLTRFGYALSLRMRSPASDWAEIAATAGYYDQSHLGRDFRRMTRETPAQFLSMWQHGMKVWSAPRS